jgi:hypothetical protein
VEIQMGNAFFRLWLVVCLLAAAGCGAAGSESRAEAEVLRFHDRYNRERFEDNFAAASPAFQSTTTRDRFVAAQERVRGQLGAVRSRERVRVTHRTGVRGRTVSLFYRTTFERGERIEEFTFGLDGEEPRLVGYSLQPVQP